MIEKTEKIAFFSLIVSVFLIVLLLVIGWSVKSSGYAVIESEDESLQVQGQTGCADSDDRIDYQIRGKVRSCIDGNCEVFEDSCSGNSLNEYYCDGNKKAIKISQCSEICESGACAVKVAKFTYRGGGGGGGSSSSVQTQQVSTVSQSEGNTYELGTITAEKTIDVLKDDKTYFTIGGNEYYISMMESSATQANFIISGLPQFTLIIGESKTLDLNSDGSLDATFWLRSVNVITNKAKVSLR